MERIDVGIEYYHRLANRDKQQGDGTHTAIEFRRKYLGILDNPSSWLTSDPYIELDFTNVKRLGPSFANEAFAYFTKYAAPEFVLNKIVFTNLTKVQKSIIDVELKTGYKR